MTNSSRIRRNSNARRVASWIDRAKVRAFLARFEWAGITPEDCFTCCRHDGWLNDFQLREIETGMRREVNWSLVAEIINRDTRPAPLRRPIAVSMFSGAPWHYMAPDPDPTPRRRNYAVAEAW